METNIGTGVACGRELPQTGDATRSDWLQRYIWPPLAVFVVSRLLLLILFACAHRLLPSPHILANQPLLPPGDPLWALGNWARPWFRFDTGWYVGVAQHGYHWGTAGRANTNFLPLYPALIRALQPLTLGSAWLSSWVVANLACLAAFILLWRWALGRFPTETAMRALVLTVCFPFAFFLSTPYAEPLFLSLALAAFLLAEQDRWPLAIVAAGMSTITRPVGLAVVLALIAFALARGRYREAVASLLALLPLLCFAGYLAIEFGRPLGFLAVHSYGWVPPSGGVLHTIAAQFHTKLSPFDRVDAALAAIFLGSAVLVWRRLGPGYAIYVAVGVLLPLAHGLVAIERYVVVLFPAMAAWAGIERRALQAAIFMLSVLGLILASLMYAAGYTVI
jgi:hypothetical protein